MHQGQKIKSENLAFTNEDSIQGNFSSWGHFISY